MGAYWKDIIREIKNTFGRFFSLLIITALGASSVVGIQATAIDMRLIRDKSYKNSNLYDLQLKSTVGFSNEDIDALKNNDGVIDVIPTYTYDVFAYFEKETRTVRTHALPDNINKIEIVNGRLPENSAECVVEQKMFSYGEYNIGDTILLGLDNIEDYNDIISNREFTIVGVVSSPLYIIEHDRGSTALGDGQLFYYMYLHPDAYKIDIFTDIYITMKESKEIDNLSEAYSEAADNWKKEIEKIGDSRVAIKKEDFADAQKEIDDGWNEYNDGIKELEEELANAEKDLEDAKLELMDAEVKLTEGQKELDQKIADGWEEINKNEKELKEGQDELNDAKIQLDDGQQEINIALKDLNDGLAALEAMAPYGAVAELDQQYDTILYGLSQIEEKQAELNAGRQTLEINQGKINTGLQEIEKAKEEIENKRIEAQKEIDDGWAEYKDGIEKYEEGLETYAEEEADALKKLADAKEEIIDAQESLDEAPTPEWFYLTRKDGVGFESYYQDTLRLQKIGYVFPLVFYLVAIMVSLTTMSRMVEEHRTQIGVYKALGYSGIKIMGKYLIYALSAGGLGGFLGVAIGNYLFPKLIIDAYGYLYYMPPLEMPLPIFISFLAIGTAVGSVLFVTIITCKSLMSDAPALLMRPKSPVEGKRVLIERIPFLWNRFGFITKVTARNIFRYKKRFIMTLLGIAGCSALLLTAFGLRDSIGSVATLQYGKLTNYNARAYTKDIETNKQRDEITGLISDDYLLIREESVKAKDDSNIMTVALIVPDDANSMNSYMNFFSHKGTEPLPFSSESIFITEKMARELKVSVGENLEIELNSGKTYSIKVTGIVENYITHYIYMSPSLYREILKKELHFNGIISLTNNSEEFAQTLLKNENVRAVVRIDDLKSNISDSTDALGIVTIVLIVLACALAMVVLFNLTNINISERIRELATIKVLGFYDMELAMYIYRENGIVTAMGILLGLGGGILLHGFVLRSAEIDMLAFPHVINIESYGYAIALSAIFAIFVNLVMNIKLTRIDMVESLKSIE